MKTDLLLFTTTRAVIKGEEYCRAAGFDVNVVTVPKDISPECGMALTVPAGKGEDAVKMLADKNITAQILAAPKAESSFDLLTTVEQGGCSAKLPANLLIEAIRKLPRVTNPNLLVGLDTVDDAGVYKLTDEIALIETTDFFPPICSDPYEFGQIAATNALSDVFAMGGRVLTAMNLVMFPADGVPLEALGEILAGGQNKVTEAGGAIVGGHTIADYPPKYGLAVTGVVHPDRIIANHQAKPGETLILSKPLGTGVLVAGQRIGEAAAADYRAAIDSMRQLNRRGAEIMQKYNVRAATDITGFGLLGHALNIANASKLQLRIEAGKVPLLPGVRKLVELGCIPGGAFRNLDYVGTAAEFTSDVPYELKMLLNDPQTSGGLLMCVSPESADVIIAELRDAGYTSAAVIGETAPSHHPAIRVY
ncbi:MAG: selenide, water dikinase SelD [Candidatus Riflebacteria bacterium]|nr:selenide, water dikinase SelD [Candidatus Riflebacteria bacterium]